MTATSVERIASYARHAVAGMAIALGLSLLVRIPLVASFRAALIVLAVIEIVVFSIPLVRGETTWRSWIEIALKLVVLGGGYLALSQ